MDIRIETDPELMSRIANADGVREFVNIEGAQPNWELLASLRPSQSGIYVLTNGEDAMAFFHATTQRIFCAHTMFGPTCRGRKAIETGRAMVQWMFDHGAETVWGATPVDNRKARMFNRWIGAHELPTSDDDHIVYEIKKADYDG